jgi:hypothetical protein
MPHVSLLDREHLEQVCSGFLKWFSGVWKVRLPFGTRLSSNPWTSKGSEVEGLLPLL